MLFEYPILWAANRGKVSYNQDQKDFYPLKLLSFAAPMRPGLWRPDSSPFPNLFLRFLHQQEERRLHGSKGSAPG